MSLGSNTGLSSPPVGKWERESAKNAPNKSYPILHCLILSYCTVLSCAASSSRVLRCHFRPRLSSSTCLCYVIPVNITLLISHCLLLHFHFCCHLRLPTLGSADRREARVAGTHAHILWRSGSGAEEEEQDREKREGSREWCVGDRQHVRRS